MAAAVEGNSLHSRVLEAGRGDAYRLRLLSRLWSKASSGSEVDLVRGIASALNPSRMWRSGLDQTWTALVLVLCLISASLFTCYWLLRLTLAEGSSKQTHSLWQLSEQLNADTDISYGEVELDSDEYEYEAETEKRRCLFNGGYRARAGLRRLVGREAAPLAKRGSVIRIVSSDPTSTLCENPLQVELETQKRALIASSPFTAPSTTSTSSPTAESPAPSATTTTSRRSSSSVSPAPGRRRRESGRLASSAKGNTAGSPPVRSPSIESVRNGRSKLSAERSHSSPKLRASARLQPSPAARAEDGLGPNRRAVGKVPKSADDGWTDETTVDDADYGRGGATSPSVASNHSFVSANGGSAFDAASPLPSPASSTFPHSSRLASILKKDPQTFRSGLLSQIDISYSLMQRTASLANVHGSDGQAFFAGSPHMVSPFLATGGQAPPPYSPANPAMPSSSPPSLSLPWLHRPSRQIRLTEPDWSEHVETHERARERLETAAHVAASGRRSASFDISALQNMQTGLGGVSPGGGSGLGVMPLLRTKDDSDEFWFERFTPSTAAAGRDWDWRKRRARAARTAAMAAALSSGQAGAEATPAGQTGPLAQVSNASIAPPTGTGNVAMTDVQLQKNKTGSTKKPAATRKQMPIAPLISFTDEELPERPNLAIDTGSAEVESATSRKTPSSPLRSPRGSRLGAPLSPGGSNDVSPRSTPKAEVSKADMAAFALLASASAGTGTLNSAIASANQNGAAPGAKKNGSATASLKRGMGMMMRRRTSASDAFATSSDSLGLKLVPSASLSDESLVESRRSLDSAIAANDRPSPPSRGRTDSADSLSPSSSIGTSGSNGSISSLSVPYRFSSLTSMGRKMSLGELRGARRASSPIVDLSKSASGVELIGSGDIPAGTPEAERNAFIAMLGLSKDVATAPRSSADAYGASPSNRVARPEVDGASPRGARPGSMQPQVDPLPTVSESSEVAPDARKAAAARPSAPVSFPAKDAQSTPSTQGNRARRTSSLASSNSSESSRQRADAAVAGRVAQIAGPHSDLRVDVSPARLKRYQRSAEEAVSSPTPLSPLGRGGSDDGSSVSAQLAAASSSSPPVAKTKTRSGSRSSILKGASGARSDLSRTTSRVRRGSRASSISSSTNDSIKRAQHHGRASAKSRDTAPMPTLQPEPAPMGMAARARSASISSNGSRSSSTSRGSRRDTLGALTSMTPNSGGGGTPSSSRISSSCNTPDESSTRRGDPFGFTPISPTLSDSSMSSVLMRSSSSSSPEMQGGTGSSSFGSRMATAAAPVSPSPSPSSAAAAAAAATATAARPRRPGSSPPPNMPLPDLPSRPGGFDESSVRAALERGERARQERRRRSGSLVRPTGAAAAVSMAATASLPPR